MFHFKKRECKLRLNIINKVICKWCVIVYKIKRLISVGTVESYLQKGFIRRSLPVMISAHRRSARLLGKRNYEPEWLKRLDWLFVLQANNTAKIKDRYRN